MSRRTKTIIKAIVFISLFTTLFGAFFNEMNQFPDGILKQFYGNYKLNIIGLASVLVGWVLWEFGIGKKESRLLIIISIILIIAGSVLISELVGFIGAGIAVFFMIIYAFGAIAKKEKENVGQNEENLYNV